MTQLFDLPNELIFSVLHMLDPASFYICLQTSTMFRNHALNSKALLNHHISGIPGHALGKLQMEMDTASLIRLFGKRASQHLRNGAASMADLHTWIVPSYYERKRSVLLTWPPETFPDAPDNRRSVPFTNLLSYVLVDRLGTIKVYFVEHDMQAGYLPRLTHTISLYCIAKLSKSKSIFQVEKVAQCPPWAFGGTESFTQMQIAVLYRVRSSTRRGSPFKLLVFGLDLSFGPILHKYYELECDASVDVDAMTITPRSEILVSYSHRNAEAPFTHGLWIYDPMAKEEESSIDYPTSPESIRLKSTTQIPMDLPKSEQIASISCLGESIHLLPTTFPMPQWTLRLASNQRTRYVSRRDTTLPDAVEVFTKHSLGRAIAYHHHHKIVDDGLNGGDESCVNTALELVISRESSYTQHLRKGAYILKAMHYPHECVNYRLDRDYTFLNHVFVAVLDGLPDLSNLSSIGLKVAVSPRAHRIAIASWKTVQVWSLDPQAFLDPDYSLNGVPGVPGDYAFIEGCGWQFYASERIWKDCVMLLPVELPNTSVIFDLEFRTEDELWGWSSEGIVRWNFDVNAQSRREKCELK